MHILFPDEKVYVDEYFDIHQDREVPIVGFFIIAPIRKGIRTIDEFTQKERYLFIDLVCKLRTGMKEELGIEDVYLFQNEDTTHRFHLWIFPRWEWMEPHGRKIQSVRPIMERAKQNRTTKKDFDEVKVAAQRIYEYMR